jgi:hypothetical protein
MTPFITGFMDNRSLLGRNLHAANADGAMLLSMSNWT